VLGSPVLLVYLLAVSVGITLMTPLISRDPLREGFFSFMVGISLATGGIALGILFWNRSQTSGEGYFPVAVSSLIVSGVYLGLLIVRYAVMYANSKVLREAALWLAIGAGLVLILPLVSSLAPDPGRVGAQQLNVLFSAAVLGSISHALILGHWYLVTPKLTLAPLVRMNRSTLAFLYARCVWILGALAILWNAEPVAGRYLALNLFSGLGFLFMARVALGLVFPIALHHMTEAPLSQADTQPATGLLYVSSLFIVGCELAAIALSWRSGIPV